MTLRRYSPLKESRGTVIPERVRTTVTLRDKGCAGARVGFPEPCGGSFELDHVRASGGIGMKSPSTPENLVRICAVHHRWKTEHGREARPLLLAYLESVGER